MNIGHPRINSTLDRKTWDYAEIYRASEDNPFPLDGRRIKFAIRHTAGKISL
ncbi:MAG: hypothetical protein J7J52_01305 [Deltaproteobacteria bacterium]|nr:hypothetical protein [Deltaproteobacteria bacterium]